MKNNSFTGSSVIPVLLLLLLVGGPLFSQEIVSNEDTLFGEETAVIVTEEENLFGTDDENLFSNTDPLVEIVADENMEDLSSLLLTNNSGVELGGSFYFDVNSAWTGIDPEDLGGSSIADSLSLNIGATLFLDARPNEDSRVFGKADISSPFYTITGTDGREFEDIVAITELFADFNWDSTIFFRAGKQTVNWGVGRFFSPGDLLSLSRIDPENPEADPDGPVALKINYPLLLNNFYLYTVIPAEVTSYSDIVIAPMAEFVLGSSEISLGAYYQFDHAPAAMTAVTTTLGDFSLYGEGYVSYGSDKTFVEDGGTTITYSDKIFLKGTIGAGYSWSDDLANYNLSFSGQYYYNGEGYDDPYTLQELIPLLGSGVITSSDLLENGRHYGAGSLSWRDMWGSDFSLSLFLIENFSSLSGMIKPAVSWSGMENIDISLSVSRFFGDTGEEYSVQGSTASVSLGVSIGGTSF